MWFLRQNPIVATVLTVAAAALGAELVGTAVTQWMGIPVTPVWFGNRTSWNELPARSL